LPDIEFRKILTKKPLLLAGLLAAGVAATANAEMLGLGPWANRSEVLSEFGPANDTCHATFGPDARAESRPSASSWIDGFLTAVAYNDAVRLPPDTSSRAFSALERYCDLHPDVTVDRAFTELLTDFLQGGAHDKSSVYFPFGRWTDRSGEGKDAASAFGVGAQACREAIIPSIDNDDRSAWIDAIRTAEMMQNGGSKGS
jgi:hypothetical protein